MHPRRRNARDTEVRRQIDYLIAQTCSLIILLNYLIFSSLLSFLAGNQPWLPFHPSTCRRVAYWLVDAYSIKMLGGSGEKVNDLFFAQSCSFDMFLNYSLTLFPYSFLVGNSSHFLGFSFVVLSIQRLQQQRVLVRQYNTPTA